MTSQHQRISAKETKSGFAGYEPYLLLSLSSVFFASNIVVGRFAAGHVPPLTMNWLRWTVGFLVLLPFAWRYLVADRQILLAHWRLIVTTAAVGFSVSSGMNYLGLQYTEALNGLLINSASPLFIALWMLILFRIRLTWTQAIGILASLIGVTVIIARGDLSALAKTHLNFGDILLTFAVALFGLYSAIVTRRPVGLHPVSLLAATIGASALMLTPVGLAELASGRVLTIDATTIAVLVYVGIFPSAVGYLFFNRGVLLIGANRAAPFLHLVPAFGSVMAIAFLGEQLHVFHIVGYALVLVGITVAARTPIKAK